MEDILSPVSVYGPGLDMKVFGNWILLKTTHANLILLDRGLLMS